MSSGAQPELTPSQLNYAETAQWKTILQQALADLRVSVPAIVQSVDYTKNPPVVTVQIAIREVVRTPSGPQETAIYPISNVPIVLPSAGGFSLTLPVAAGDEGLLTFCDMCMDLWWTRGGVQNQFERRRHDLSDCGFSPGMRSQARPIPNWSQNSVQLRTDDGTAYIELAGGGVVNIVAPGGVNINGNLIVDGTTQVDELTTGEDGLNVTGPINATGEITAQVGGVLPIPLSTHLHQGVQPGIGNSGTPIT